MQLPAQVTYNDVVLLASLLYSGSDIVLDWDAFSSCHRPVHGWLLVSYAVVSICRGLHLVGAQHQQADGVDFLLNLRQKGTTSKVVRSALWLVTMPVFVLWTVVGSWWFYETMHYTPHCLPTGTHASFMLIWQALSYGWILMHLVLGGGAAVLEGRLRRAEGDLRQLADADVFARWGDDITQLSGYNSLPNRMRLGADVGLTAAEILSLPGVASYEEKSVSCGSCPTCDCPICLAGFQQGESVRTLAGCGHSFHRGCIDLWLLRSAECPLCKRNVHPKDAASNDDKTSALPAREVEESTVRARISVVV